MWKILVASGLVMTQGSFKLRPIALDPEIVEEDVGGTAMGVLDDRRYTNAVERFKDMIRNIEKTTGWNKYAKDMLWKDLYHPKDAQGCPLDPDEGTGVLMTAKYGMPCGKRKRSMYRNWLNNGGLNLPPALVRKSRSNTRRLITSRDQKNIVKADSE